MREFLHCHYDDHVQILLCVFVFYLTCVGLCGVRLRISCCLWYDVMHILYVLHDVFDVILCYILGLLVSALLSESPQQGSP